MKKIALVLFFLLIATSSYASHIDWVDVADKDAIYSQNGMIAYNQSPIQRKETMYYEDQHSYNNIFGSYHLDAGDQGPSLTSIFFDTTLNINSTVPTNNVSGDVFFTFETSLSIYDLDINNKVYSSSRSQLLTHGLDSSDQLLLPWENSLTLTPDHNYVFIIDIFFGSSNNSMLQQISALRSDVVGMAAANVDWRGTTSVDFNSSPVPEPGTLLLFGTGLAGLAAASRIRRK